MESDWRLTNQMNYLFGVTLIQARYQSKSGNDHDHCEFCWDKFAEEGDVLHFGYCTADRYRWICPTCYSDFKDMFQWKVVLENEAGASK